MLSLRIISIKFHTFFKIKEKATILRIGGDYLKYNGIF
jgi:hypothetical protein